MLCEISIPDMVPIGSFTQHFFSQNEKIGHGFQNIAPVSTVSMTFGKSDSEDEFQMMNCE